MATTLLRERMRELMRLRNYSVRTEETYIERIADFARHFGRSPERIDRDEIHAYQVWLRDERHVSSSTFNLAAAALRFLYTQVLDRPDMVESLLYAKRERPLPIVLSTEELIRFLEAITSLRQRVILTTIYAGGLRLSEALGLQVEDIDSSRMVIRVRLGKGKKDRYVPLSPVLLELLRAWWRAERPRGFLFPSPVDPSRPLDPSSVQRYVHKAGLRAGLQKKVTPRTLRHTFATHLMEQGTGTRVIQVLLGHANVRTTEGYIHVSPQVLRDAASPLDRLLGGDRTAENRR